MGNVDSSCKKPLVRIHIPLFFINIQNDSEISLEKKPVIGDDEKS
jgi:hypothetical protein